MLMWKIPLRWIVNVHQTMLEGIYSFAVNQCFLHTVPLGYSSREVGIIETIIFA